MQAAREGRIWNGCKKGVIDLQLIWALGHHNLAPNKHADEEAKKAVQGDPSNPKHLPPFLRKQIPHRFINFLAGSWAKWCGDQALGLAVIIIMSN